MNKHGSGIGGQAIASDVRPYNRARLAEDLIMLSRRSIDSRSDLETWNRLAHAVQERLLSGGALDLGIVPEAVHDFLADAEIRLSDPDYAAVQHRVIGRVIVRLRQESGPARAASS